MYFFQVVHSIRWIIAKTDYWSDGILHDINQKQIMYYVEIRILQGQYEKKDLIYKFSMSPTEYGF